MGWQPGFVWKEVTGKANTFLGASMRSKEVAIMLWQEPAAPPALSWQWQVLHMGEKKASGGEASRALGVISSQQAYSRYVGTLTDFHLKSAAPRKLRYIWAPDRGAAFGEGRGVGRVPGDRTVRMRVQKCVEDSQHSLWSFIVTRGAEKIASGYRSSKADAVFSAESAYDDSLV
ncbi:hypothetical protein [Pseudovibrio sp. Ad37]|uniref:hypothetical protein n=1 Tax=Pseudovibrio sp. Ad37 TaxID=989422 RepID=UPI0007AE7CCA|nr:hypothetical protein [Pseudovibrio sp. Ad37]KZL24239.1 hypothetical protein PsAD37_02810 [Pseudovibrio sp. Ad37]